MHTFSRKAKPVPGDEQFIQTSVYRYFHCSCCSFTEFISCVPHKIKSKENHSYSPNIQIKKTVIIPQGAILLWSWRAPKITIHKGKRTIQQTKHHHHHQLQKSVVFKQPSWTYASFLLGGCLWTLNLGAVEFQPALFCCRGFKLCVSRFKIWIAAWLLGSRKSINQGQTGSGCHPRCNTRIKQTSGTAQTAVAVSSSVLFGARLANQIIMQIYNLPIKALES